MRKKILVSVIAGLTALAMSMTAYAATAQDIINKNPTSYTAGTQSVYGPKLTQDQLNAVAQATADFVTNNITEGMSNDQKIRAGYDYIKNNVTYVDWDKAVGANTAYGGLVTRQAACSGMTRGFIALMEPVDVKAYLIHASSNSHQWIMVEFDSGFKFIDIDANISAGGQDIIYEASTHPYAYDTASFPAVGSHSADYGAGTQGTLNGWKEENGKWYYYENGNRALNKWIDGIYYVGPDGAMLTNTTTPDGYKVGADGAWETGASLGNGGLLTKALNDSDARLINSLDSIEDRIDTNGNPYIVLAESTTTIKWLSSESNIKPDNLKISYAVFKYNPSTNTIYPFSNDGTAIYEDFQYDKEYDIKINDVDLRGSALVNYCKQKNIVIAINVFDPLNNNALGNIVCYK